MVHRQSLVVATVARARGTVLTVVIRDLFTNDDDSKLSSVLV